MVLRKCTACGLEAHAKTDLILFVKDKTCKHDRQNLCMDCNRNKSNRWNKENKERKKEYDKQYYTENKERVAEIGKQWYTKNRERALECKRRWRQKNKKHTLEYKSKWSKDNPDKRNAYAAKRRAAKVDATPVWFEKEKKRIEFLYATAKIDGLHVDHIVPLNHDMVCGLHCLANLQLLTPSDNMRKSNSFAA